jgi:hypothetical protein
LHTTFDRHGVADVVAVAVRDQDQVRRHLLGRTRRFRVARQERVNQDMLVSDLEQQTRMTEPAHTGCHDGFASFALSCLAFDWSWMSILRRSNRINHKPPARHKRFSIFSVDARSSGR